MGRIRSRLHRLPLCGFPHQAPFPYIGNPSRAENLSQKYSIKEASQCGKNCPQQSQIPECREIAQSVHEAKRSTISSGELIFLIPFPEGIVAIKAAQNPSHQTSEALSAAAGRAADPSAVRETLRTSQATEKQAQISDLGEAWR
jgi:hypothetical protein